jgi:acetolactate synthase regulatory subunit
MGLTHADLLIALGVRFDDRVTGKLAGFAPHAKVIHVDVDPSEIGKNRAAEVAILGHLKCVLQQLIRMLRETRPRSAGMRARERAAWQKQVRGWKTEFPLTSQPSDEIIKPQHLMAELDRLAGGSAVVSCDVGQHQMWAAQHIRFNAPRLWINSGGLGSMGFGLPAAIGAQIACPAKPVFALVGDGGFQMSIPELATLANYGLPIKVVVVNNGHLGMVRQWQELFHRNRLSAVRLDTFPDVTQLAAAYGLRGITIKKPQDLGRAMEEAVRQPGPCLLNVEVAPFENVYPMVPTGAAISEMVLGPPVKPSASKVDTPHVAATIPNVSTGPVPIVCRTIRLRVQQTPGALQRILAAITVQGCGIANLAVRRSTKPGELNVALTLEGEEKAISRAAQQISKLINVIEVLQSRRGKVKVQRKSQPASRSKPSQATLEPWEEENDLSASPVEGGVY